MHPQMSSGFLLILAALAVVNHQVLATTLAFQPSGIPFKIPVIPASGLKAEVVFSNLTNPRGIAFDSKQNLLVVERGVGVTGFRKASSAGVGGYSRTVVVNNTSLTHGIAIDGNNLYVTSNAQLLRYAYTPDTITVAANTSPAVVVDGLPSDGDITTHTILLEKNAFGKTISVILGSGPASNIDITARDPSSGRSQVRRFPFLLQGSSPPTWLSGELVAFGIRNPAGFAFQPTQPGQLYVVENGASIDNVTGLTATFVNDNPADELNLVAHRQKSISYGFPDCTTLWNSDADPIGDPQYTNLSRGDQISLHLATDPGTATRDDAWCRVVSNNIPPRLSFQAHSVPLDIKFYTSFSHSADSLPENFIGNAFVSLHGSFSRNPATGYSVVRVPFPLHATSTNDLGYKVVVQASNVESCSPTSGCIRPVGIDFSSDGVLFVSSDGSGELFKIKSES